MKTFLKQSIILTICCIVLLAVIYPLFMWGIAQVIAPNNGKGEVISINGKQVGYSRVGQSFSSDQYFNGRPSAVGYNAAGSAGSNKGPSNPDYLAEVQARIDTFMAHNPGVAKAQIPAELVTASGSGLDPHISPQSAYLQVARVAKTRKLSQQQVRALVDNHVEAPFLGILGTSKINVLKLNIALDQVK